MSARQSVARRPGRVQAAAVGRLQHAASTMGRNPKTLQQKAAQMEEVRTPCGGLSCVARAGGAFAPCLQQRAEPSGRRVAR